METTLMDKTVGIIGLGIMGGAIARNLVERGWCVIGFDTDATKRAELALANIEIAGNVEQVARDVPIIMTSLPSPASAAERAGLDPNMVVDMVGPGAGGSRMFQMRAPMMVQGVYEPATMKISIWRKDMAVIADFAEEVGCTTPLFALTQPIYEEAMTMGLGDQDTASVFEVLKKTIITNPKSSKPGRE